MRPTIIAARHWLDAPAAASYARMRAAGLGAGITSAGRSHAEQVALFTARYRVQWTGRGPYGDVRWWQGRRYVRAQGAAVAPPGSAASRHEQGLSLDLPLAERAWMRTHGAAHGWFAVVPDEPWHWEYQERRDTHRTAAPPPQPTPPTWRPDLTSEEDDMERIITALYRQHLKRTPRPEETDYWLDQYAAGQSAAQIRAAIVASPEARQKAGK